MDISREQIVEWYWRLLDQHEMLWNSANSAWRELEQLYVERERLRGRLLQADPKKHGYVYLFQFGDGQPYYKIGRSKSPRARNHAISVKMPFELVMLHTIYSDDYVSLEKALHIRYANRRRDGEWFELSDQDVAFIRSLRDYTCPDDV